MEQRVANLEANLQTAQVAAQRAKEEAEKAIALQEQEACQTVKSRVAVVEGDLSKRIENMTS